MPNKFEDTTERDHSIYAIYCASTGKIVYVGQTTYERDGSRFVEHVTQDVWAPWFFQKVVYDPNADTHWPYYPRKLANLKEVTLLEVAAAEEYYWELYGGLEGKLENRQQPLKLQTFNKYKNANTWRPKEKGFAASWAPKL